VCVQAQPRGHAGVGQCVEVDFRMSATTKALLVLDPPTVTSNVMVESLPPGFFFVGAPLSSSPVLVTGNFMEAIPLLAKILETCSISELLSNKLHQRLQCRYSRRRTETKVF